MVDNLVTLCQNEPMLLAPRLRELRHEKGYSIKTLAKKIDVDHAYLSRIESGVVHPSEQVLLKIARALRHDEAELLLLNGRVPSSWQDVIQKSPQVTTNAIRNSLEKYQVARPPENKEGHKMLNKKFIEPQLVFGDCRLWLENREENSIHGIITDPPFGLLEYTEHQLKKLRNGRGGVWRIPPKIGSCERKPLPRFTILSRDQLIAVKDYFEGWGKLALKALVPGGHLCIASNPLISPFLSFGLASAGFERRGTVIRTVRTLRGGDRPKLAEKEFEEISVIPRSCYEPWELFRKPISEKTVAANLRKWKAGGLRRTPDGKPFPDIIKSEFALATETAIAPHPTLKPQRFLRQLIWSLLPLGSGIVLDPFMGSGSSLAAASALGYESIGIELDPEFFKLAESAVPQLRAISVPWEQFETNGFALNQTELFDNSDHRLRTEYAGSR